MPGGPSDKAGNSYERRWTVFALLDLLSGRATSLRIEVPGQAGLGAEFRLMVKGEPEWHQAKRQRSRGSWTIANMSSGEILQPWWNKIQKRGRCTFVTSSGCEELLELVERAASAVSWEEFDQEFLAAHDQRRRFELLRETWGGVPSEAAYQALTRVKVQLIGESELAQWVEDRLAVVVDGDPATSSAVLAQLADDSCHRELTSQAVLARLAAHRLRPAARALVAQAPVYGSVLRDLLERTPALIGRDVELQAVRAFAGGPPGYQWIVGAPWAGKTALSAHMLEYLKPDVDCVAYFLQQRRSDADSERFLAAVLPQLAWLVGEPQPERIGSGEFVAMWERACARAAEIGRPLLLVVDGVDEDLRPQGLPSVASLLPSHLGDWGHVLATSRPNPKLPDDLDIDHPLRNVKALAMSQSTEARQIQQRALHELGLLLQGPALSSDDRLRARDVLGTLAVARGALTLADISQITGLPVREVREIVNRHAARVLEPLGDGTRFQFAHQVLLDTCIAIFDADQEMATRLQQVSQWADSWRKRSWPPETTPLYLLSEYPFALVAADAHAALSALVNDTAWVVASVMTSGVGVAQSALVAAAVAGESVGEIRRILDYEAHHLGPGHPLKQPGYVARQLGLAALRVSASATVLARLNACVDRHGRPRLNAMWTTRPLEPALTRTLGRARGDVSALAITADGRIAFAAEGGYTLTAWDVRGSGETSIIDNRAGIWSLVVSLDGRYLVAATDNAILSYEIGSALAPWEVAEYADAIALSHVRRRIYASAAVGDRGVWGWDLGADASLPVSRPPADPEPVWQDENAEPALALALTEDDCYLVAVNYSGDVVTWYVTRAGARGIVRHRFGKATAAALTPDARLAVVVDTNGDIYACRPLERKSRMKLARIETGVLAISVDPEGRYAVLVASDGTVRALDTARPDSLRSLGRHDEHLKPVTDAHAHATPIVIAGDAPSMDVDYTAGVAVVAGIAVTAGRDGFLRVWSLSALENPSLQDPFAHPITSVCLTTDGRQAIAGAADGTISVWEMSYPSGGRALEWRSKTPLRFAAISPDDQNVIVVGEDYEIRTWDISRPSPPQTLGWHEEAGNTFALAAGGRRLIGFTDVGRISIWNLENQAAPRVLGEGLASVRAVAAAPHHEIAVSVMLDRSVYVLNLGDEPRMRRVGRLPGPPIRCVAVTADVRAAITGRDDGTIQVWDLEGREDPVVHGEPGTEPIRSIRIGSNGRFVATLSRQGTARVWDLSKNIAPYRLDSDGHAVTHVGFTPNGSHLITGHAEGLRLWDLETHREITRVAFHGLRELAIADSLDADGRCSVLTYSGELGLTSWSLVLT